MRKACVLIWAFVAETGWLWRTVCAHQLGMGVGCNTQPRKAGARGLPETEVRASKGFTF